MTIFQLLVLSILEGLTEFLPISSTAHLILAQKVLGMGEVNEIFTVVVQFGAILAALFFFRKRIGNILATTLTNAKKGALSNDLGVKIMVGVIPTLLIAFALKSKLAFLQNSLTIIALSTISFGILFYLIEKIFVSKKNKNAELSFPSAVIMGIGQGLSIIPGVSRSGVTIATGLTQKLDFGESIELSFLMGIPVMLVATGYEMIKVMKDFSMDGMLLLGLGVCIAFVSGVVGIQMTLGFLRRKGFLPFMLYRIVLGIAILGVLMVR